jgi:hypothetical protein
MSLRVATEHKLAIRKSRKLSTTIPTAKRTGKPFTVYLADDLSHALAEVSKKRMVHKSVIVRVAVERLLNDLETGQLELPLGI